jgi:hypothetical protein
MILPIVAIRIFSRAFNGIFCRKGGETMDTGEMHEGTIMMKDGRVMTVQNGELTLLEEEVTLPDGTRVMLDGTVVMADGKTRRLAEGETLRKFGQTAETGEMAEMGPTDEMTGTETHDPS